MGRKMKSLESQLEKQQQDLSEGQRGSLCTRVCTSVFVCVCVRVCAGYRGLGPNQGALWQEHL